MPTALTLRRDGFGMCSDIDPYKSEVGGSESGPGPPRTGKCEVVLPGAENRVSKMGPVFCGGFSEFELVLLTGAGVVTGGATRPPCELRQC